MVANDQNFWLLFLYQSDDKDGERQVALTTGLVDVEAVLKTERLRGFTFEDIKNVVELNDKQRFALVQRPSDGAWLIRANQGHTIQVGHDQSIYAVYVCAFGSKGRQPF